MNIFTSVRTFLIYKRKERKEDMIYKKRKIKGKKKLEQRGGKQIKAYFSLIPRYSYTASVKWT